MCFCLHYSMTHFSNRFILDWWTALKPIPDFVIFYLIRFFFISCQCTLPAALVPAPNTSCQCLLTSGLEVNPAKYDLMTWRSVVRQLTRFRFISPTNRYFLQLYWCNVKSSLFCANCVLLLAAGPITDTHTDSRVSSEPEKTWAPDEQEDFPGQNGDRLPETDRGTTESAISKK